MSLTLEQVVRLTPGGANFRQWYAALKAEIYKGGGRRYLLATDRLEIPDYDLDCDLYYASLIGSLVDDTQLKYVEVSRADEQHPTRVFTNYALLGLRNVCAGTLADRMALRGELGAFAWDEATDYDTNVGRFQRLLARLEAANDTTSEADRIFDFLHRVPHRFFTAEVNAILTALTHDPERYQTLDSVVQQIRVYAKRESLANGRTSSTAAQHGNAAFQTSSERACHYCHIPGHIARDCRNKQADIKRGVVQETRPPRDRFARPRNNGRARRDPANQTRRVAASQFLANEAPHDGTISTAASGQSAPPPHLVLDSGASSHMTNDLSLLHDVHPVQRTVHMTDGHIVHVTQAGTLRVRGPHNTAAFGETLHVSTMTNTRLSVARIIASPSRPIVVFSNEAATISINGKLSLRARQRTDQLFYVEGQVELPAAPAQDIASTSRFRSSFL